jgi:polysaccharide biosynthesis PFTS motif protein
MKLQFFSKVYWVLSSISVIVIFLKHRNQKSLGNHIHDLAILFALSPRQIRDFCTCLDNERFKETFKISDLYYKKLYICSSLVPSFKIIKSKMVLNIYDPTLIVFLIKKKIEKYYYAQVLFYTISWFLKGVDKFEKLNDTLHEDKRIDLFSTISTYGKHNELFELERQKRNFKTHVIHYAQNTLKIKEFGELDHPKKMEEPFSDDIAVWIKRDTADIHWVWTQSYANYLSQFNRKIEYRIVGSIQFQLRKLANSNFKRDKILVFDSPPLVPKSTHANSSYYDFDTVTKFIGDIVETKEQTNSFNNYRIVFKLKRVRDHVQNSGKYLKFLERFEHQNRAIIIDADTNIYDVFDSAILSISIPFTSTALIAKEQNVKSLFYYPHEKSIVNEIYDGEIPLICGKKQLFTSFQLLEI